MDSLLKILFGLLGYIILITPVFFGIIYPIWVFMLCGITSGMWIGPWLYRKYIQYILRKNNPFRKL
jgi:uncharacterized protein YneF (UPF0154 family)